MNGYSIEDEIINLIVRLGLSTTLKELISKIPQSQINRIIRKIKKEYNVNNEDFDDIEIDELYDTIIIKK